MRISSRRVLLVAVASGGLLLAGAAPAIAQPVDLNDVTDQVSGVTDSLQQEEGPLQPVTDLVCSLTKIELLGECQGAEAAPQPVPEKPKPEKPAPNKPSGDKHDGDKGDGGGGGDDDGEAAPVGGVETGAGGTADDGAGLLLPLSVLGGAALTGGAIVGARRLRGNQSD